MIKQIIVIQKLIVMAITMFMKKIKYTIMGQNIGWETIRMVKNLIYNKMDIV